MRVFYNLPAVDIVFNAASGDEFKSTFLSRINRNKNNQTIVRTYLASQDIEIRVIYQQKNANRKKTYVRKNLREESNNDKKYDEHKNISV